MEVSNEDLRLTILGCFRYSLGRMTYMPSHTVMMIKNNKEIFRKQDWESFQKEILEYNDLGMECDRNTWKELVDFSITQNHGKVKA